MNFEKSELRVDDLVINALATVLSVAKTLTALDNGVTYIMTAAAGKTITLPAPAAGLKFKFVVGLAFATTNWIVKVNGGVINGPLVVNGAALPAVAETQINFALAAEALGDYVELVSDGTNWFVSGCGNASGSITATAP